MTLTSIQTIAFAALVVYFGKFLKNRISFIDKYNLPSPVIGGFIVAFALVFLKTNGILTITFDKAFEESLMIAFFASVGYSASFKLLKEGGKAVVLFLLLSICGLLLQIVGGVAAAYAMGEHLLLGVLTGPVALTGGPGTALAFGPVFEAAGVEGASVIGLTAAMGGIVLGGLIGTPISTYLIKKKNLRKPADTTTPAHIESMTLKAFIGRDVLFNLLALLLIMGIGTTLSAWISGQGVTLPVYIGSMIIAAIFRNIEDAKPILKIDPNWIEEIGSVALTLFIATAIMTLRLEELKNAALPLIVFLTVQSLLVIVTAIGPAFWVAGKDYEAAVISSGYVGFMMGTTANAMANMSSLTQKYGLAPKAFLVVPLVGSCFIDFFNAAIVTFCINFFK